jgi:hypothetical protein
MLPEGKCRYIDGQIYPDGNFYVLDTQHIKHNGNELKSALNGISTDISNKVDKVTGKGLSTEDYTTAEKNKLSGISEGANKIGYELKQVYLKDVTWYQSAAGIYFGGKISIPNLSKILGITIYDFARIRSTDVITPVIYWDGNFNGISFLSNTNSFDDNVSLSLMVFGIV